MRSVVTWMVGTGELFSYHRSPILYLSSGDAYDTVIQMFVSGTQ